MTERFYFCQAGVFSVCGRLGLWGGRLPAAPGFQEVPFLQGSQSSHWPVWILQVCRLLEVDWAVCGFLEMSFRYSVRWFLKLHVHGWIDINCVILWFGYNCKKSTKVQNMSLCLRWNVYLESSAMDIDRQYIFFYIRQKAERMFSYRLMLKLLFSPYRLSKSNSQFKWCYLMLKVKQQVSVLP